ncbi:MAG: acetylglutamate kinase [Candidatus Velthaea sp.]|jgi:acetylglutamate kinase
MRGSYPRGVAGIQRIQEFRCADVQIGGMASPFVAPSSLVIKFGGSVAGGASGDPVLADLVALAAGGTAVVLVHGGGPAVDAELRARNVTTRRIAGLRVTDGATLEVVEEILGRRVNAAIVAALIAAGGRAQRVAGDEGVFIARKLELPAGDLGFVGEIERIETAPVRAVLDKGAIPVVSPIGADAGGQRYNINADTAAGALAAALAADAYVAVTDVTQVRIDRDDPASGISRMTVDEALAYRARGVFVNGMLPKIDAALTAVRGGVAHAFICGPGSGAVPSALAGAGTEIVR